MHLITFIWWQTNISTMSPTLENLASIIDGYAKQNNIDILRINHSPEEDRWFITYYEGQKKDRRLHRKDAHTHPAMAPLMNQISAFLKTFPASVTEIAHPRDQVYLMWGASRQDGDNRLWYQSVDLAEN